MGLCFMSLLLFFPSSRFRQLVVVLLLEDRYKSFSVASCSAAPFILLIPPYNKPGVQDRCLVSSCSSGCLPESKFPELTCKIE